MIAQASGGVWAYLLGSLCLCCGSEDRQAPYELPIFDEPATLEIGEASLNGGIAFFDHEQTLSKTKWEAGLPENRRPTVEIREYLKTRGFSLTDYSNVEVYIIDDQDRFSCSFMVPVQWFVYLSGSLGTVPLKMIGPAGGIPFISFDCFHPWGEYSDTYTPIEGSISISNLIPFDQLVGRTVEVSLMDLRAANGVPRYAGLAETIVFPQRMVLRAEVVKGQWLSVNGAKSRRH